MNKMQVLLRSARLKNSNYSILKRCHHCRVCKTCLCINSKARIDGAFNTSRLYSSNKILSIVSFPFDGNRRVLNSHLNFRSNYIDGSLWVDRRYISLSNVSFDKEPLKPSSKIEVAVQELKKQKEDLPAETVKPKAVVKKSIKQRVIDELVHYYHGFRLLFIDMKISVGLVWRVLNGATLTRREYRLLTRTVGDMFRLVPFSVFIVVPFLEFLLPVFIKVFPGMLPSTFQTATEKEAKLKQSLKVKLEMAKFLQQTLEEMSAQHKDRNSALAKEFTQWFQKVRTSGEEVSNEEILKFSKLFQDDITLDALSRSQLVALCRVLEVHTLGTNNMLRFQLRMKLRHLAADDKMIQKEGVNSLTLAEVQQACKTRGMRAFGVSEAKLKSQLSQWLDLSLNEKVPPSLLLLSRALMLPETIPTGDKLKATISILPEHIVTHTKAAIGEREGKISNTVRLEVLKEEERKVKEERQEQREHRKQEEREKKEELIDKAPIISADTMTPTDVSHAVDRKVKVKPEEGIQSKDIQILEDAVDSVTQKKIVVEKTEIEDLKESLADYKEDVDDLNKAVADMPRPEIRETKAASRLFKKVNKMINKMDLVLCELEAKEKQLKKDLEVEITDKKKEELLKIDDIMDAIKKIKKVPDDSRLLQIQHVLSKIDDDQDGSIKVEDVLKVIEFIGKENVHLNKKQIGEIIDLIDKEEILEVEEKIEKALLKDKESSEENVKEAQKLDVGSIEHESEDVEKVASSDRKSTKTGTKSTDSVVPPLSSIDPTKKDSTKTL